MGGSYMKKYVTIFIIALFVILFSILFFKIYQSNAKYSSADTYALVQKGIENMQDMQNVCIERKNEYGIFKNYYKGNKMKMSVVENSGNSLFTYSITDLNKEKQYIVSDAEKVITVQKATNFDKGLQYEVFNRINTNDINVKRELSYIKDEKIEEKDCIFVKEITYYKTDDNTFQSDGESNEEIRAYWIEKSTGFVIGAAMIKPTQTSAAPETLIKNISFNDVVDSDFDLPTDYTIYDTTK